MGVSVHSSALISPYSFSVDIRNSKNTVISVNGREFNVRIVETPFREGVEVVCNDFEPPLRVSDRQLGWREALRLLEAEIELRLKAAE